MNDFAVKRINSWSELTKAIEDLKGPWIFRGQTKDWPLATSFERALNGWEIGFDQARKIEKHLIRDFRRRYDGEDSELVRGDTLYCLALMQHHGAPTRLLDCTYSPFFAIQFAIGRGNKSGFLWCINVEWCQKVAEGVMGKKLVKSRDIDETRNDSSFNPLFMSPTPKKFVLPENALSLSRRLIIQQGVFLCPGDVSDTFLNNLKGLPGCHSDKNILKIRLVLNRENLFNAATHLRLMNVNSAALFPGLDGFAQSLGERLPLYKDLAERDIGLPTTGL